MIDDIINVLNPSPYCNGVIDFLFPQPDDDIVLSKDEKNMIVDQINDVTTHLNAAKRHIDDESFEGAIEDVTAAINISTCGKCKKRMLLTAYDINHASNVCVLDEDRCETIKDDIDKTIADFIENYLPRVEEVLSARES